MVILAEEDKRVDQEKGRGGGQLMTDNLSFSVPLHQGPVAVTSATADVREVEQKAGRGVVPPNRRMQESQTTVEAWQSPATLSHSLGPRKGHPNKGLLREYVYLVE